MLKRTNGIVLKNNVFGEADLIVTYLTNHYGLVKAFAKSPRKIKSRFGSSLEPLTYARIAFFGKEEASLPRLTQSDIIRPFHVLREDFNRLLNVSEILELCLNFLPEREPVPEIFRLLLHMMATLESNVDSKLYYLFYKMRLLQAAGYLPRLSACGKCGIQALAIGSTAATRPTAAGKPTSAIRPTPAPLPRGDGVGYYNFCVPQGSVICSRCSTGEGESIHLSHGALRFQESLLKWNPSTLDRINAPEYLVHELTCIIDAHIRYVLGPLKTVNSKR
jgi:DNA repair protein RecO (recombination protein O)